MIDMTLSARFITRLAIAGLALTFMYPILSTIPYHNHLTY